MNAEELKKENELAEWLIDQYIAMRMGTLDKDKCILLDERLSGWDHEAVRQIVAGVFGRIVYDNFREAIENDLPAPWDIVVQTVQKQIKSDIRKFSRCAVEK